MFLFFILLCSFLNDAFFFNVPYFPFHICFHHHHRHFELPHFSHPFSLIFPLFPTLHPPTLIFQFIRSSLISSRLRILPARLILPVIEMFFTSFSSAFSTSQLIYSFPYPILLIFVSSVCFIFNLCISPVLLSCLLLQLLNSTD